MLVWGVLSIPLGLRLWFARVRLWFARVRSWFAQSRLWFARARAIATDAGKEQDRLTRFWLDERADAIALTPPACGRFFGAGAAPGLWLLG